MINITLVENDPKPFKTGMETEMNKAIKHFEGELIKIRTGRAHASLVDDIAVACYGGSPMPLKQIASITAPEPRLLVVQPWDANVMQDIEKAILASDVGLTPINDGKIIRLTLPEMSTNRRDELVKILHKKLEECRIAVRNVRRDFNNLLRDGKKDKVISENFFSRLSDILQEVTDKFIAQAEQLAAKKEKEITSF
ncbi:MAG: ribosome recycling factor [Candidatus Babeliales bacterium]